MKKVVSMVLVITLVLAMSTSVFAAPAPALSDVQVYGVWSSQYGGESIPRNAIRTIEDHGGAVLEIYTYEDGFSKSKFAKMNNRLLLLKEQELWDYDNDGIADGWLRCWDASGFSNGTFTYEATSTNYPWNTMTDSLYIK